jgi:NitT/TauT family transport system permease protein
MTIWEFFTINSQRNTFLFSRPSKILDTLVNKIYNGELIHHFFVTAFEAFTGLFLGILAGSVIGFLLLYFPKASKISKYYVVALSSIPIFALAPMMIIWFGLGVQMKIAMAFFSTVFIAIFQAYQGGQNVASQDAAFFKLNGASDKQKFWQLTFPASIDWLIQSLKLNSGLAILGAFIGEFIASDSGLGYIILKASGLYDVSYVLSATICIVLLTLIFNFMAGIVEKNKLKIVRKIAVGSNQKRNK